ncbi:hypothetical protein B0T20DRAFT_358067 [Sordaria brevicollis]|uniref:Uncharacterized protein n=1 Tax=Sordaria brevicollis TaxID=83679 RepID=A0AAE0PA50_SORBR|nr:hypothetical protein B0T20DRAFT_358067 [Sordaria brevicollis]
MDLLYNAVTVPHGTLCRKGWEDFRGPRRSTQTRGFGVRRSLVCGLSERNRHPAVLSQGVLRAALYAELLAG